MSARHNNSEKNNERLAVKRDGDRHWAIEREETNRKKHDKRHGSFTGIGMPGCAWAGGAVCCFAILAPGGPVCFFSSFGPPRGETRSGALCCFVAVKLPRGEAREGAVSFLATVVSACVMVAGAVTGSPLSVRRRASSSHMSATSGSIPSRYCMRGEDQDSQKIVEP